MNLVVLRFKIRLLAVAYMRAARVISSRRPGMGHPASRQANRLFSAHKRLARVIGRRERGAR